MNESSTKIFISPSKKVNSDIFFILPFKNELLSSLGTIAQDNSGLNLIPVDIVTFVSSLPDGITTFCCIM